jgi:hypothetical protein
MKIILFRSPVMPNDSHKLELLGAWNPRTVRDLCQMVKEKKPNILFLIETISRKKRFGMVAGEVRI